MLVRPPAGVSKIDWFEASGSRYNMGLVDSHGNPYPAYDALKLLSTNLGPTPTYVGWVRFNTPRDEYVLMLCPLFCFLTPNLT